MNNSILISLLFCIYISPNCLYSFSNNIFNRNFAPIFILHNHTYDVPGDNDDDTILDAVDDDDDNDGILDVDEIAACNNNLTFEFYDGAPAGFTVNNIPTTGAVAIGLVNNFNVDALTASLNQANDTYGIRYTGIITIATAGNYTFFTRSDDGSSLSIDGTVIVNNDGLQAPTTDNGNITLTTGDHLLEVLFFENTGGEVLQVQYQGPGIPRQNLPFSVLSCNNDIDNDGLPNFFDTDSDGDGCPDALEGNGLFGRINLDTDESFGDNVNANGIVIIDGASTQQQNISAYQSFVISSKCGPDNDLDGVLNSDDLDDDNDGILDFEEAVSCPNIVSFEYYDGTPAGNTVNNIPTNNPDRFGTFNSFDVDALIASLGVNNNTYGIRYTGLLNITTAGQYTFFTRSDDGSSLEIDDVLVVNNDGLHGAQTRNGTIELNTGAHFFTVLFFENTGGEILEVEYQGPGIPRQNLPFSNIRCNLDSDNDDIPNFFDTDSDDDGCLDAIEAAGDFTINDIDPITNTLAGNVDARGLPLVASPTGQPNTNAVISTVGGSVTEASFTSPNINTTVSGQATFTITVVENNGNTNFRWQQRNSSGGVFTDLIDGGVSPIFSGTTTNSLLIDNIPSSLNNSQYRVIFTNENSSCIENNSTVGILTLRPITVITNRRITYRIKQ